MAKRQILRDDPKDVREAVLGQVAGVDAIITTGGTGITSRDSTYEAIAGLFEKRIDGFGELFRMLSYAEIGSAAMLTRACAGVRARHRDFSAPWIARKRRPPRDDQLILPGDRPRGPRAAPVKRGKPT